MKRQVVVIHGGTSFDTYEDYLQFLRTREITLERLKCWDDWKASLGQVLGEGFEVIVPRMPNGSNARYQEWCIWLERCQPFLHDGVVLMGHSLGGIFLVKYLAEHQFPVKIQATVLIGAPHDTTSTVESLKDFAVGSDLGQFKAQAGEVYLVYSQDDPVVPFSEAKKYQALLPQAHPMFFTDKQHFHQDAFPELVALLKSWQ